MAGRDEPVTGISQLVRRSGSEVAIKADGLANLPSPLSRV
jgi:hypothetical protein